MNDTLASPHHGLLPFEQAPYIYAVKPQKPERLSHRIGGMNEPFLLRPVFTKLHPLPPSLPTQHPTIQLLHPRPIDRHRPRHVQEAGRERGAA